jgi:NAD(P)-dependent dehydrogenase (short-subunit alcohol dehydrogenase family)
VRFQDKVVLIIGGNSGIGLAAAVAFAAEGGRVIITGRDAVTLRSAQERIGHDCVAIRSDVSDLQATESLMQDVGKAFERIDVLFVNAGIGRFAPIEAATSESWDEMLGVNLKGPYFAVQKALPLMGRGGAIVLTSSIGHCMGIAGNSVYGASKAGLRSLARNLGAELVDRGIRVNCLSPGPIDTPLFDRSGIPPADQAGMREMMTQRIPMKRFGTSEEAAAAALFLSSSESSFVTGIDLLVDGGVVSF